MASISSCRKIFGTRRVRKKMKYIAAILMMITLAGMCHAFIIGGKDGGYLNGTMDEVAVYSAALTDTEAEEHYKRGVMDLDFIVRACDDLSCEDEQWFGRYGMEALPDDMDDMRASNPLNANMTNNVLLLHMDDSEPSDSSGNGNTVVVRGGSLEFDGYDDRVRINDSATLDITDDVTVEAWVYQKGDSSVSPHQRIVDKGGAITAWFYDPDGSIRVRLSATRNGTQYQVGFNTNLEQDRWYHIAFTYDKDAAERLKLYIDGEFFESSNYYSGSMGTNNNALIIGNSDDRPFNGTIDEVRIYSRVLPDTEIKEHYQSIFKDESGLELYIPFSDESGAIVEDKSGNSNDGTLEDFQSTAAGYGDSHEDGWRTTGRKYGATTGIIGKSLAFNGHDDFIGIDGSPELDITGPITISLWAQFDEAGTDISPNQYLIAKSNGAFEDMGSNAYHINIVDGGTESGGSSDYVALRLFNGTEMASTAKTDSTMMSSFSSDTWYHIAATWDGTTMRIYRDGTEIQDAATSFSGPIQSLSEADLLIGGINDGYRMLKGKLDDIAVWDRELSGAEISDIYSKGAENYIVSPGADISEIRRSRYMQYKALFWTYDFLLSPILQAVNIIYAKELPDVTKFVGEETTDFNLVDLENVIHMTLATETVNVTWQNPVNSLYENYDAYINMDEGFVSVDVNNLDPTINGPAIIVIENVDCDDFDLYHATGFHSSTINLVKAGVPVATEDNLGSDCTDNTKCTSLSCSEDTLTLMAQHFDGFGVAGIKWVNATNVTEEEFTFIDTELQIGNYTIDDVWVGIIPPGGSESNYSMWNVTSTLYIKDDYNATLVGNYTFTVYVNNSYGDIASKSGIFEANSSNIPPTKVILLTPENNTFGFDSKPTFTWEEATDPDGGNLTYNIQLVRTGCYGMSGCTNPLVNVTGINATNYTLTEDLDFDSPYDWTVRAHDGETYGEWADAFNYTVLSLVDISLVRANISVTGLEPGDNESTEDDSPLPFLVQNNGNIHINVSLKATKMLWFGTLLDTKYLQFKVDEEASKPGSFNISESTTDWKNVSSNMQLAVVRLDYDDSADYAEIDLGIEVPQDEPPGEKSTNILMQAVATK